MPELGPVRWPPTPIETERLVLRAAEARDRDAFVELYSSPEVGTYIGGPQPREELLRTMPEVPGQRPGFFTVELDGAAIGMVTLDRRGADDPYPFPRDVGQVELGYLFLPHAWGHGYATEAGTAVLDWFAAALPNEPVVLRTQTANTGALRAAAKLGFGEVLRYHEWDAEQWFGVRTGLSDLRERIVRGIVATLGPMLADHAAEHLYVVALTTDSDVTTVRLTACTEEALADLDGEDSDELCWWPDEFPIADDDVVPDGGVASLTACSTRMSELCRAAPDHDQWREQARAVLDQALADPRVTTRLAELNADWQPVRFVTDTDGDFDRTVTSIDALNADSAHTAQARAYFAED